MKRFIQYTVLGFVLFTGCVCKKQKKLNRDITLWRMDRIPYGTKFAFDALAYIFPNADIRATNRYETFVQNENPDDTPRALIILSPRFMPEPAELNSIQRFAAAGNQVFISAMRFDDTVMHALHFEVGEDDLFHADSSIIRILEPLHRRWLSFGYPGYPLDHFLSSRDSAHSMVIGKDAAGRPDFIRIPYAHGGAIYIHLNPLAFSNFFLLHKKNKSYYDIAFSYLPSKTAVVEWSDHFRYTRPARFSSLRFILNNRSLKWAFWLTILLFVLLFAVESKRKQRPVAEIPAWKDASVDFVKTVGRLYFQQKNNQNLALKMITAFLEHIRSAYRLPTSSLDKEFIQKLAFRTGRPADEIEKLVQSVHEIRLKPNVTDNELMDLHEQILHFNKPAS